MARFSGKVVLVTGGASGIGKATAIAFANEGAKVVLSGRRVSEGETVAEEIRAAGGDATFVRADVAKEADVKNLVEQTVAKYGRLDVAFNNAGIEHGAAMADFTEEDYRKVFDIKVLGVGFSMKYEIAAMRKTGGGAIVNTSSVLGHIAAKNFGIYNASKHAVEGLTKTAALELGAENIRVNAVAPAIIETEMYDRLFGGLPEAVVSQLKSGYAAGRFGQPQEVAAAVLFLASDAASFVTGMSLPVDSGLLAT
jgi:NAD(P)-dependent dehydrogenase (short-subunit alcohol dehydrogenase family)